MTMTSLVDVGRAFWIAFIVSAVLAYPIWRLLIRLKSRQTVSEYAPEGHQVKQGTPTMGGIIIAAGAMVAFAYEAWRTAQFADQYPSENTGPNYSLIALLLFAGFCLIGFIDDFVVPRLFAGKRGLGWKQKILMQVVIALMAALMVTGWTWQPSVAVFVFLILFFSNAYNFADGLDALAGTILMGLSGGFAALAWHSGSGSHLAVLMSPFFAAAIPFLYLNSPPAKVFMGDVGSLPIGAVLGLVASALIFTPAAPGISYVLPYPSVYAAVGAPSASGHEFNLPMLAAVIIASLVMVVELVPVPLQILSVKLFKRKLFPYTPIHHAFEKVGWKETRVVGMFALTQIVLSALALSVFMQAVLPSSPTSGQAKGATEAVRVR